MQRSTLALARHGESTWNVERRMLGFGDPPLTPRGLDQARALAASLAGSHFDLLICSDLQRAVHTARCVAEVLDLAVDVRAEWREQDKGRWTGLTRDEVRARWPDDFALYRNGDPDVLAGGGESRRQFQQRIHAARDRILTESPGRAVLVITHRGVIRALVPEVSPKHATLVTLDPV